MMRDPKHLARCYAIAAKAAHVVYKKYNPSDPRHSDLAALAREANDAYNRAFDREYEKMNEVLP